MRCILNGIPPSPSSTNINNTDAINNINVEEEHASELTTAMSTRWNLLISSLVKAKRDPLEEESLKLEQGTHPSYVAEIRRANDRYEQELKRIEQLKKRETSRIEAAHQQELDALDKEYESRVSELVEVLWHELEEKKRQQEGEMAALDISRWDGGLDGPNSNWTSNNSQWANSQGSSHGLPGKKQLRRRPNEAGNPSTAASASSSAEQPTSGGPAEKKSRKRSPGAGQGCPLITQTLLPAQEILEDMEILFPSGSHSTFRARNSSGGQKASSLIGPNSHLGFYQQNEMAERGADFGEDGDRNAPAGKKPRKVVMEQGKLICDSKSFHRGQNVFIKSANTNGKSLQAVIIQINDSIVQFRSSISGDTRTVIATKEDLESGRVLVWKRY